VLFLHFYLTFQDRAWSISWRSSCCSCPRPPRLRLVAIVHLITQAKKQRPDGRHRHLLRHNFETLTKKKSTTLQLWSINGDPLLASVNTLSGQIGPSQHVIVWVGPSTRSRYNILATFNGISLLTDWNYAPKLVKESEEDSPDVAELPGGAIRQ
jgi:hypothetical protein